MFIRMACLIISAISFFPPVADAADPNSKEQVKTPSVAQEAERELSSLEKAFAKQLSGVALVGHFTKTGESNDKLSEERYTIDRVSKLPGKEHKWRFVVRIQYGKYDLKLPLDLEVRWAGDTPMVTLTDFTITGMGTFSSRVLFYGDQYAGTWQHGKLGGHLFGKIVPQGDQEDADASNKNHAEEQ